MVIRIILDGFKKSYKFNNDDKIVWISTLNKEEKKIDP